MGCCSSSLVDQDYLTTTSENYNPSQQINNNETTTSIPLPGVYYNKSRPFKRVGLMWTSDTPITISQLEQKRYLFWETAPNYGGKIEIWQALQVAFSETDVIIARSILEAANVLLPTGNPCEGCFDELGNEYTIPIYCVVPPANLIDDGDEYTSTAATVTLPDDKTDFTATMNPFTQSIYSPTDNEHLVRAPDSSSNPFSIIVRLSTDKDVKTVIHSKKETIGILKTRIFQSKEADLDVKKHTIRFIYLGHILLETMSILCEEDVEEIDPEQAFSQKGAVRITNDCVIQALVATRKEPPQTLE
ncbi:unnamed protein product [Mucor hiemalis]